MDKMISFSVVLFIETTALIKLMLKEHFFLDKKKSNLSYIWQI